MKHELPKLPIGCRIPEARVIKGISYLEIHEGDGGFYLYQYENENIGTPKWDSWTDDLADLLQDCKTFWDIDNSLWKSCTCESSNIE